MLRFFFNYCILILDEFLQKNNCPFGFLQDICIQTLSFKAYLTEIFEHVKVWNQISQQRLYLFNEHYNLKVFYFIN